jgi:hypothetical protein
VSFNYEQYQRTDQGRSRLRPRYPDQIKPVWFDWQQKKHSVQEITYRWQERDGDVTTLHFAVSDGADLFELAYNTGNQLWLLASLEVGNG